MLNHNIYSLIFRKLSYTDLLKIKKLNFNITNDTLAQEAGVYQIKQRLTELGIDADDFCQKLWDTKCVMAGSFPLQCVLGEKWEKSDIDIFGINENSNREDTNRLCDYVNYKHFKNDEMNNYGFHSPTYEPHDFEKYLWLKYVTDYKIDKRNRNRKGYYVETPNANNYTYLGIKYIRNYKFKNIDIQFIECDPEVYTKSDQVLDTFDLDFCKISFDGKYITSNQKWNEIPLKKGRWISNNVTIKEMNSSMYLGEWQDNTCKDGDRNIYLDKRSNISKDQYQSYSTSLAYYYRVLQQKRLAKYEARGFSVVNLPDYEDFIEKLCPERLGMSVSEYNQQVKQRTII
jgi:hypothetical protein